MPNQLGDGEGFTRRVAKVITIDGAAATFTEDYDLEVPVGYVALIHAVSWLRDGNFNGGAADYEVMAFLYGNQTKSGALSATLSEFEDPGVIDGDDEQQGQERQEDRQLDDGALADSHHRRRLEDLHALCDQHRAHRTDEVDAVQHAFGRIEHRATRALHAAIQVTQR